MKKPVSFGVGAILLASVGGCAVVPPSGPSVAVMPGQGKSFEAFQADDSYCRNAAQQSGGGTQAAQAATNNAVGTAVVGTALGAAAGALVGSAAGAAGGGAAVGAGLGLLAGSSAGANGAAYSSGALQQQYDITYVQCMASKGNQVPQYASAPPPPVAYPGYYPAPAVVVGPGFYYGRPYYHYGYGYRY
jgi:hypothetical protein